MWKPHFWLAWTMLAFCGCVPAGTPSATVREFLGKPGVKILYAPTRVQTFRIYGFRVPAPADAKKIDGFAIRSTGPDQDAAFGKRLGAVFLSDKTYRFDLAKACIFDPGVAFRVWKGEEYLDLILCFHCSDFQIFVYDAQGNMVRRDGQQFDAARAALVRLAQEAFAGDSEIMELK